MLLEYLRAILRLFSTYEQNFIAYLNVLICEFSQSETTIIHRKRRYDWMSKKKAL